MDFLPQLFNRVACCTFYMFFVSSELFLANRSCNICGLLLILRFQRNFFDLSCFFSAGFQKRRSACPEDHFATNWLFQVCFIFGLWAAKKAFGSLAFFWQGCQYCILFVHRNVCRKYLFLKKFFQCSIKSGNWEKCFRIFEKNFPERQ